MSQDYIPLKTKLFKVGLKPGDHRGWQFLTRMIPIDGKVPQRQLQWSDDKRWSRSLVKTVGHSDFGQADI